MARATFSRPALAAALLAFVAGSVDTIGFVALFGLFTAHVTGNFVLIGAALVSTHHGIVTKLCALPVFILAVAFTATYTDACERRGQSPLRGTLAGQLILLAAFAIVGAAASPFVDADQPLAILAGLLGVAAMSVQNASSKLLMSDLPPTTVMTGSVTQFAIDATRALRSSKAADRDTVLKRLPTLIVPVAAFGFGAIAGALLYLACGFVALLAPMLALAIALGLVDAGEAHAR